MKRITSVCMLLAALGGCTSPQRGPSMEGLRAGRCCGGVPPTVPGVQGSWGTPVPMVGPYTSKPPAGADLARQMMSNSVPLQLVQQTPQLPKQDAQTVQAMAGGDPSSGIVQAGAVSMPNMPASIMRAGGVVPPGMPPGPGMPGGPNGLMAAGGCCNSLPVPAIPGAVAAVGVPPGPGPSASRRSEVRFAAPAGMKVAWYGYGPDGRPGFAGNQIEVPGRYNFVQGAIYRLKLSEIANRPGVDLYPTLEVVPSNYKTDAFIAHSAVPVFFTEEDFDQIASGNFLVKVIYLPFPQYQDIATAGPDEIVSTRLEPGLDPIQEACKRGSILLVVRVGNIDLEAPNTPPMDAPQGGMAGNTMPPPPMMAAGPMMPAMPIMAGHGGPIMMPMPPGMLPPGARPVQGMPVNQGPPMQAPPGPGVPVTRLPDRNPLQPVHMSVPTPAQLAGQGQ